MDITFELPMFLHIHDRIWRWRKISWNYGLFEFQMMDFQSRKFKWIHKQIHPYHTIIASQNSAGSLKLGRLANFERLLMVCLKYMNMSRSKKNLITLLQISQWWCWSSFNWQKDQKFKIPALEFPHTKSPIIYVW